MERPKIANLLYFPSTPVLVYGWSILKTDPQIVHEKGCKKWLKIEQNHLALFKRFAPNLVVKVFKYHQM